MKYCDIVVMQYLVMQVVEYKYKRWLHKNLKSANDKIVQKPNIKNRRNESSKQTETNMASSINQMVIQ